MFAENFHQNFFFVRSLSLYQNNREQNAIHILKELKEFVLLFVDGAGRGNKNGIKRICECSFLGKVDEFQIIWNSNGIFALFYWICLHCRFGPSNIVSTIKNRMEVIFFAIVMWNFIRIKAEKNKTFFPLSLSSLSLSLCFSLVVWKISTQRSCTIFQKNVPAYREC